MNMVNMCTKVEYRLHLKYNYTCRPWKLLKHCTQISTLHLTHLETFRQLRWRLFTGTCRINFLLNSDSSFFSVPVIIYSVSLPFYMHNWRGTLGLDIKNRSYYPSNLSGNLVSEVFFDIGVAQTYKISALLWWEILESNEGNAISFDIFFPDTSATAYVFLNCCDCLFLNVMRWVEIYSRNWRWLI